MGWLTWFNKTQKCINPLPNVKILDLSRLKALAYDKINVVQELKFGVGRVESIAEKEKMLVTSIFSFSHKVFYSYPLQGC